MANLNALPMALLLALITATAPPAAAVTPAASLGTGAMNDEKATFAQAVGTWKPDRHQVSIGFFTAGTGMTDRPYLVVDLTFKEGTTSASVDALSGCHIGFNEFKASPFDFNGFASQCGVKALSGELKTGGTITVAMAGQSEFKGFGSMPTTLSTWDVHATPTLRGGEFAVDALVALGMKPTALGKDGGEPGDAFVKEKCRSGLKGPLATLALQKCAILSGLQAGDVAVLLVEADTLGQRMRTDFTLTKTASGWAVSKEGAWRAAPEPAAAPKR